MYWMSATAAGRPRAGATAIVLVQKQNEICVSRSCGSIACDGKAKQRRQQQQQQSLSSQRTAARLRTVCASVRLCECVANTVYEKRATSNELRTASCELRAATSCEREYFASWLSGACPQPRPHERRAGRAGWPAQIDKLVWFWRAGRSEGRRGACAKRRSRTVQAAAQTWERPKPARLAPPGQSVRPCARCCMCASWSAHGVCARSQRARRPSRNRAGRAGGLTHRASTLLVALVRRAIEQRLWYWRLRSHEPAAASAAIERRVRHATANAAQTGAPLPGRTF